MRLTGARNISDSVALGAVLEIGGFAMELGVGEEADTEGNCKVAVSSI